MTGLGLTLLDITILTNTYEKPHQAEYCEKADYEDK